MPESTGQNKPVLSPQLGIKENVRKQMNSSWPGSSTVPQSGPVQDEVLFPVTQVHVWEGRSLGEQSGLHQSLSPEGLVEWHDPNHNGKDVSGTTWGLLKRLSWRFSLLRPFESSVGPSQLLWDCRLPRLG